MPQPPKDSWPTSKKRQIKALGAIEDLYGDSEYQEEEIVEPRPSNCENKLYPKKGCKPEERSRIEWAGNNVPRRTLQDAFETPKEWQEQCIVIEWVNLQPLLRGYVIKIGNEGRRTPQQGAFAKRLGLLPGASDLFVARPAGGFHGLFIEMKQHRDYSPSEKRSPSWLAQAEFMRRMQSAGFAATFAFGADQAIQFIKSYIGNSFNCVESEQHVQS